MCTHGIEWHPTPIKHDTEKRTVLDDLQNVDDDFTSALAGHHAFDLSHLMSPQLAQILVEGSSCSPGAPAFGRESMSMVGCIMLDVTDNEI